VPAAAVDRSQRMISSLDEQLFHASVSTHTVQSSYGRSLPTSLIAVRRREADAGVAAGAWSDHLVSRKREACG
jgi:hypothetical protein